MKRYLVTLLLIFSNHTYASECTNKPTCPDSDELITKICQRPCKSGGYEFLLNDDCKTDWEPHMGGCFKKELYVVKPGSSDERFMAKMKPGARRYGMTEHRTKFKVSWWCPIRGLDFKDHKIAYKTDFPFDLGIGPRSKFGKAVPMSLTTSSGWDNPSFRKVIDIVRESPYDLSSCLRQFRNSLESKFLKACKITVNEAFTDIRKGLISEIEDEREEAQKKMEKFCDEKAARTLLWPELAELSQAVIEHEKKGLVPNTVMGSQEPEPLPSNYYDEVKKTVDATLLSCRAKRAYGYYTNTRMPVDLGGYQHREYFRQLKDRIGEADQKCQNDIFMDLMNELGQQIKPNCDNLVDKLCQQQRNDIAWVANKLTETFPKQFREIKMDNHELVGLICKQDALSLNHQFRTMQLIAKFMGQCQQPKKGESAYVDIDGDFYAQYKLTNKGDGKYEARINYAFKPEGQEAQEMKQRTQECFEELSERLNGPGDSNIKLVLDNQDEKIPKVEIEIMGKDHRSNSAQWNKEIDCTTIIHEAMHVMGLLDEYHEHSTGYLIDKRNGRSEIVEKKWSRKYKRKYYEMYKTSDCRSHGPDFSVMSDQDNAYRSNHWIRLWGRRKSVLLPMHFQMLTNPGCYKKNEKYFQCASTAYKQSLYLQCPKKPKYCERWKDWLGDWN